MIFYSTYTVSTYDWFMYKKYRLDKSQIMEQLP